MKFRILEYHASVRQIIKHSYTAFTGPIAGPCYSGFAKATNFLGALIDFLISGKNKNLLKKT